MRDTTRLYLDQAEICAKLAEEAALPRKKEMYLRSQAKWQELADRAVGLEDERAKREAEKAEGRRDGGPPFGPLRDE